MQQERVRDLEQAMEDKEEKVRITEKKSNSMVSQLCTLMGSLG